MIKNKNNQKGVSLILTIFVMVILLAVVLFIAALLYTEIRNVKNLSDSVTAFFAADSGVEKVLYYDRNVLPPIDTGNFCDDEENPCPSGQTCDSNECKSTAVRGLCSMLNTCQEGDSSLYCNNISRNGPEDNGEIYDYLIDNNLDPEDYPYGCDPEVCNACQISFNTSFNDETNRTYQTVAKVIPSADGLSTNFDIKSKGSFIRSSRRVEVYISSQYTPEAITITNACATPISAGSGEEVLIQAEIRVNLPNDSINSESVKAYIKDSDEPHNENNTIGLPLSLCTYNDGTCSQGDPNNTYRYVGYWNSESYPLGSYYVDIEASDTQDPPVTKIKTNIPPYPTCMGQ